MCDSDLADLADLAAQDLSDVLASVKTLGAPGNADRLQRALRCVVEVREQLRERERDIRLCE